MYGHACNRTLHHRFRAVYPCLDKIFWKLLKLNISPSKPLKYSVKDSEFKQSMASRATSFDGEPSQTISSCPHDLNYTDFHIIPQLSRP